MSSITVRAATPDDAGVVHEFIVALCLYEKRDPSTVDATPASIREQMMCDHPPFESLIATLDGKAVGFCLFFQNFSTWTGKAGLYLEDIFVLPECRNKGVGTALFARMASICVQRDYRRLDFSVLKWNTPSIGFYEKLGALKQEEWLGFRLEVDRLKALAGRDPDEK